MHPTILNAYKKAQANIDAMLKPADVTELRAKFEKLSKKELVNLLVEQSAPKTQKVTKEELAYAILEDPDCAWLTFETIAEIIKANLNDANTSKNCLSWYQSNGIKKGKNVVTRKTNKEIVALVMNQ